jgi:hypothetical protein
LVKGGDIREALEIKKRRRNNQPANSDTVSGYNSAGFMPSTLAENPQAVCTLTA